MSKLAAPPATSLVDLFQTADTGQLDAIDETIADLKGKQAEIQKTINGLATIRKALAIKLHGKPPRKQSEPKPVKPKQFASVASSASPPGERIVALLRDRGPLTKLQIADLSGISLSVVGICVSRQRCLAESNGLVRIIDDED